MTVSDPTTRPLVSQRFDRPVLLAEALEILAERPDTDVVAGGTDLMVAARSGKRDLNPQLLAIDAIAELRGVRNPHTSGLVLGALTSHADLVADPAVRAHHTALSDASALVGSPATRANGTVGGNLANGSPAMELGSPLLAFDATVHLASATRTRVLPVAEFAVGPGETARRRDELVIGVALSAPPAGRIGSAYLRLEYRQAMEIAVVGAAAAIALDERGRITHARLALTAVAPTCVRARAAESMLVDAEASVEAFAAAARQAASQVNPIDDLRASADYRREMVSVIAARAIALAHSRATATS